MRVEARAISVDLAGRRIVTDAELRAGSGAMVGLIGPNGSGKSTLLRTVYRSIRPAGGQVLLDGDDVWQLGARQAAQRTAVVLQDDPTEFEFTVREVVELGRVPHKGLLDRDTERDVEIVEGAMARTGVGGFSERLVSTLSGGERQRVLLARALAQQTPVVLLDEPTNHLDVSAQLELLDLLHGLPLTVVAVLHDLNLAAAYCEDLYVLDGGRVVAHGPVGDVLTPELVADVYGVTAHRTVNPLTGRPCLQFAGTAAHRREPDTTVSEEHNP
ncbi:ABC transporter ATP-binding protein [Pseudonocardia phyllosphaerae]|uniref:ABC transporter ATP-binding protein n=1 Tax=Pseudonocardia phyllosphaerae TaxID=3390502 RepID=UPI00397D33CF